MSQFAHNIRPTSPKASRGPDFAGLPQNLRNISRMILVFTILGIFGFLLITKSQTEAQIKGARSENRDQIKSEIDKTLKVINERPDYAGAWIKLSVLYEQIGEMELARKASEAAQKLNPNL